MLAGDTQITFTKREKGSFKSIINYFKFISEKFGVKNALLQNM